MHPQLLYVYIGNIDRCLKQQAFHLTNDFSVQYVLAEHKLAITKRNNPYKGLWGDKISNVNLIVGKNGSGKTTLLDLIGSTKTRRQRMFNNIRQPGEDPYSEWFAVYHVEEDIFVIEGFNPHMFANIDGIHSGISYEYSFCVKYDFELGSGFHHEFIQERDYMRDARTFSLDESVYFLYLTNERRKEWFSGDVVTNEGDYYVGFKRDYLNKPLYAHLYKFLSKGYEVLEPEFTASEAICEISLSDHIFESSALKSEILAEFDLQLYQDKTQITYFSRQTTDWSHKQSFIIRYLELLIIDTWVNQCHEILDEKALNDFAAHIETIECRITSFEESVKYLLSILEVFDAIMAKFNHPDWHRLDVKAVRILVQLLEEVNDLIFIKTSKMVIRLHQEEDTAFHNVLTQVDRHFMSLSGTYQMLDISICRLSTGELEFVNGFSNLYYAIEVAVSNRQIDTILLLLDEPDASFHPEWSRRYIRNLVLFLNGIEAAREVKFQIILSTHSPFIVSDVPKEHISCIRVTKGHDGIQRTVHQANFGLMSNFYDIIKSDFFIDSPLGEHAKTIFSDLIQEINGLQEYNKDRFDRMFAIIAAIGDEVIRGKLQELLRDAAIRLLPPTRHRELRIAELERELEKLRNESRERP
ncbi:AAA family ATPase [Paenibacillus agricola]|uniref:AAA family ATPase n=1 Tax=Paenibacillus agricola TaxID=2716264 RepID=A0ABX0JEA2_9BACL|nr:AAA family ATPase [Paenibacillus agricola]NHN33207.1 AAA family ATPase [Paenibacillus agricola]